MLSPPAAAQGFGPQEDGHHSARSLGSRQTPFRELRAPISRPCPSPRPVLGDMSGDVFGNGNAALAGDQACRGFRSPRHLRRSLTGPGHQAMRAPAHVQPAAVELAGLRQVADLAGRRRVLAFAQGNSARAGSAGLARSRQATSHALRGGDSDPEGTRRPALVWRHRHLYPRCGGKRRSGWRSRQ